MKKALGETQTLRAGCSKAEPKFFCPAADPLPGGAGRPKFYQLEIVTTFTYKPSLVRIDACNFELSWLRTHKHTKLNPQTHAVRSVMMDPVLIWCVVKRAGKVNYRLSWFSIGQMSAFISGTSP